MHNFMPSQYPHVNASGLSLLAWAGANARFFAALAANNAGFAVGTNLTLLTNWLLGTPQSISFTVAGGAITGTATFRITGLDQFGNTVIEDYTVPTTGAGTWHTATAWKYISTISVVSQGGSANTIAIGQDASVITAGSFQLGVPWKLLGTAEIVSASQIKDTAASVALTFTLDMGKHAIKSTTAIANPSQVFCTCNVNPNKGFRP